MVFYVILQSFIIQTDLSFMLFLQALISVSMYLIFYFYNIEKIINSDQSDLLKSVAKYVVWMLPLLIISFNDWSPMRSAGLLGNPNVTSHTMVLLLPFALTIQRKRNLYILLGFVVLFSLLQYASRSAMLAVIFGVGAYLASLKFIKNRFRYYLIISIATVYLSYMIVDIMIEFLANYGVFFADVESRIFYTGYNGRDKLFEQAFQRFEGNEFFGLGFDGSKFEGSADHILSTHNGFLEILLRLGVGGAVIFGVTLLVMLWNISKVKDKYLRSAAFMSFIALMSLSTNSSTFFVFNYYFYYFMIIYCFAVFSKKIYVNR